MGLESLLGRMMIRETARATVAAARRNLDGVTVHGATVRASTPGGGTIVAHIDGDPPGQATQMASSTGEFYQVGDRVLVLMFPPSGATVLGRADAPGPWQQYPSDWLPWYSAQHKTPTITNLTVTEGHDVYPAGATTSSHQVTLPADRLIVVTAGLQSILAGGSGQTVPEISSVSNNGTGLAWEQVAAQSNDTDTDDTPAWGYAATRAEIWRAYNTTGQAVTITLTYSGDTTGCQMSVSVLSIADAAAIQDAAGTGVAIATADGVAAPASVTTTVDRAQIVAVTVGNPLTSNAWDGAAAASGCTIITNSTQASGADYRYEWTLKRTSAVTTPAATSIGMGIPGGADGYTATAAVEIMGTIDAPTIGDGTVSAWYRLRGKSLELRLGVVAGSTTTFGGGPIAFRLPPGMTVAASPAGGRQSISGTMLVGTNEYRIEAVALAGATSFSYVLYQDGSATVLSSSAPTTLGSTFRMNLNGTIEIA